MRTLALRGGERVAVIESEWRDAFGVVTRGRVQLELRDGEPGPVLGPDSGFWLRDTGVRALRNPDHATATVRIATPSGPTSNWRKNMKNVFGTGILATLAAMAATTLVAALARALGVDFEVTDGETIPVSGVTFVTGVFSLVGVGLAAALKRWSPRPADHFVRTAIALTVVSLVPPVLVDADAATTVTLIGLHLVAAAVMIPTLARALRSPVDGWLRSARPRTATRAR